MTLARPTRAVRNANPGNLRHVPANNWLGLGYPPEDDHGYCRFIDAKFGFRALIWLLRNYGKRHGLSTIGAIIPRFAPAADSNNEAAYIKHLEDLTGRDQRTPLDFDDQPEMKSLARAIAIHESGAWAFETVDLDAGCALAFATQE